mmetsp:Transcript_8889/g.17172  ORF Transcript_8889/g.17172 Transcript_8889/m.17172 type:complete len:114 (+) Transcript_8889:128-469(+)
MASKNPNLKKNYVLNDDERITVPCRLKAGRRDPSHRIASHHITSHHITSTANIYRRNHDDFSLSLPPSIPSLSSTSMEENAADGVLTSPSRCSCGGSSDPHSFLDGDDGSSEW